jgi:hypothetical protein
MNHQGPSGVGLPGYALYLANGQLTFEMVDAASASIIQAGQLVPADNNWHFVAVTISRNDPNGGKLFMDATPVVSFSTVPVAGSLANPSGASIGASLLGSNPQEFFNGCIDEVEFFTNAIFGQAITNIFVAGSAGKCKPPCTRPPTIINCPGNIHPRM